MSSLLGPFYTVTTTGNRSFFGFARSPFAKAVGKGFEFRIFTGKNGLQYVVIKTLSDSYKPQAH